jgi:NAD(P)H-hydrate repair Nnr-like enzyme with NAD(P)H-hydrate dehydratase domain
MGNEEPSKVKRIPDFLKIQVAAYAMGYPDLTVSSAHKVDADNIRIFFRDNKQQIVTSKLFPYISEHCFEDKKENEEIIDEKSLERAKMFVKI